MEHDQRDSTEVPIHYVHFNSVASWVSADPKASVASTTPSENDGGNRGSGHSAKTAATNRSTLAHQPLTKTEKWIVSRYKLKLLMAMVLGALALFVSSYDGMDAHLYGANSEREWLWWVVAVPFYVFVAIYFARFVGSYLMRVWLWEIVNSPWVHGAIITLLSGILSEDAADDLFAAALSKPAVVGSASTLTASVITSQPVQEACVGTVVGTLLSTKVADAVVVSAERLLRKPRLQYAMAGFVGNDEFVEPIATQAARILRSEEVACATVGIMERVLEDRDVRSVIKRRAESVAGDAELFTAGRRGLYQALMGRPRRVLDREDTGSTSCEDGEQCQLSPSCLPMQSCSPQPCRWTPTSASV